MTSSNHYLAVAKEIAKYLNAFGLAFKTYSVSELDEMMKAIANEGARVSTKSASEEFENMLLHRGFVCFPSIQQAVERDGFIRIIRSGSLAANLLQAFQNPGPSGDEDLAHMLQAIKRGNRQTMPQDEQTPA